MKQISLKLVVFTTLLIATGLSELANAQKSKPQATRDKLGVKFMQHIVEKDFKAADKMVDMNAYGAKVAKGVFDEEPKQRAFLSGFIPSLQKTSFTEKVFAASETEQLSFAYLGTNGKRQPVLRMDYSSGGHEYIKLILRKNKKGALRIVDFGFASTGALSSTGTANATKYLIKPSESILKRLLGGVDPDKGLIKKFEKISEYRLKGEYQKGYEIIDSFPEELRNQKELILNSINFASGFDESLYRQKLSKFAELYGDDPAHAFMLIDHYYFQQDWNSAIDAVNVSKKEWADDAALNVILTGLQLESGLLDEAINSAEYARTLEPESEMVYWSSFSAYLSAEQFGNAVEMLDVLKETFYYEFTSEEFLQAPENYDLVQSKAFKAWAK